MSAALLYKCEISGFNITSAFEAIDVLFEYGFLSASCAERHKQWFVEVLSDAPIDETMIVDALRRFKYADIKMSKLEDINWLKKCFENFKPLSIGGFYIYGPHLRGKKIPHNKVPIEIAAATAFGSGEHPTTWNCIAACEAFFDPRKHRKVLDIGCGSCILSIALAKLGARDVTSCDNDPEAVRVSKENVALNKVAHKVNVFQNYACEFERTEGYDLIVSNILAEPLIGMSDEIVTSLKRGGLLILSGFTSNDSSVLKKYSSYNLNLKFRYDMRDWTTLVFEKAL